VGPCWIYIDGLSGDPPINILGGYLWPNAAPAQGHPRRDRQHMIQFVADSPEGDRHFWGK
jgi:hypothetical protein